MTDAQIEQAKYYADYYRYMTNKAKTALENYIFGGLEIEIDEAAKFARIAKEHREEFERLTRIKLKVTEGINTPDST